MMERKGATATITKTVARQRSGSGNSIEMLVEKIGRDRVEQDRGVLPTTGSPRVSGMETSDNSDTVQTKGASHTTQAFVLRRPFLAAIPLKHA